MVSPESTGLELLVCLWFQHSSSFLDLGLPAIVEAVACGTWASLCVQQSFCFLRKKEVSIQDWTDEKRSSTGSDCSRAPELRKSWIQNQKTATVSIPGSYDPDGQIKSQSGSLPLMVVQVWKKWEPYLPLEKDKEDTQAQRTWPLCCLHMIKEQRDGLVSWLSVATAVLLLFCECSRCRLFPFYFVTFFFK